MCSFLKMDSFLQVITEFEEQWANVSVPGWENKGEENGHVPLQHTVIDLDYYSSVEELMEVGPEKLNEVRQNLWHSSV